METSHHSGHKRTKSLETSLNPNALALQSKGAWVAYILVIIAGHLVLLSVPWFNTSFVWTLTNALHAVVVYYLFHHRKGVPFDYVTCGTIPTRLTFWEQIDDGIQFTKTRKFLIIVPILLFIGASFYAKHDPKYFVVNFLILVFSLVPKLPHLHGKRLFGINKY